MVSEEKSFESVDGRRTDDGGLSSYKLSRSLRLRGANKKLQVASGTTVFFSLPPAAIGQTVKTCPPLPYIYCNTLILRFFLQYCYISLIGALVAQWAKRWPTDLEVTGSSPTVGGNFFNRK